MGAADSDVLETEETEDESASEQKKFQKLLKGSWQHLSDEAKDAYRLRMQKLRDRIVCKLLLVLIHHPTVF